MYISCVRVCACVCDFLLEIPADGKHYITAPVAAQHREASRHLPAAWTGERETHTEIETDRDKSRDTDTDTGTNRGVYVYVYVCVHVRAK